MDGSLEKLRPEELQDLLHLLHGSKAKSPGQPRGTIKKAHGAPPRDFDAAAALGAASSGDRTLVQKRTAAAAGSTAGGKVGPATRINGAGAGAEQWRERGNQRFKGGDYEAAIAAYTASIEALPTALGYANRAMAELKVGRRAEAERDCTQAIAWDPSYVKAHQRRGAARRELGNLAGAIEDFEAALRLEPANKATAADRRACVERWMQQQGFGGVEPVAVPVVQAKAAATSAAGRSGEDELLRQVSTAPLRQAERQPAVAVAVVQEVAAAEVDDEGALPPLPPGRPAAAPQRELAAEVAPALRPAEASAAVMPPPAGQEERPAGVAASAAQASSSQRAAQRVPPATAMKPPRTGVEFEKAWKGFKGDSSLQAAYLRLVPPAQLPALLKQALTSALLASLLHTLLGTMAKQAPEAAVALLEALPLVPRFDVNLLSLSSRERGAAAAAWEAAAEGARDGSAELALRLAEVRKWYRM